MTDNMFVVLLVLQFFGLLFLYDYWDKFMERKFRIIYPILPLLIGLSIHFG